MRIGIVSGEYPPMQGGVGAYTRILAQTFTALGHDVFVFTSAQAEHTPALHDTSSVHLTNSTHRWGINTLRKIKRWAHAHQIDLVSLQFETAAFGMSPWIHFLPDVLRSVPVVTTFHDLLFPYLFPKAGRLREWIVIRLARASVGVIATNHEDMTRLAHLPCSTLIPIGSNILTTPPEDYDRSVWREKAGAEPEDFLIAHFGFLNRSKGIETLLHGLKALQETHFPVKLVMIGGRTGSSDPSNATYADEIDTLINELNLTSCVHWTGFVTDTDVSAYLDASDAVVLPFRDGASYRRGSLMAAVQHGCTIITTQPQVYIPTFQHGENMLLFPPGDVSALVATVQGIRENPTLAHMLSEGALRLSKHFDWENIAQACITFYGNVRRQTQT